MEEEFSLLTGPSLFFCQNLSCRRCFEGSFDYKHDASKREYSATFITVPFNDVSRDDCRFPASPFYDEAHFWLNGYVNKQNCRIWSEVNPQVYVETPLHPEKLTIWCALWAGGILLQKL
ncbi:hypothetical protein TNCV_2089761 [Trichonephila clavipes]|nr:hypothetical protein TNCV_2089761 [Trichonephila clavipes]